MADITWKLHLKSPPEKVYDFLNSDKGRAAFWAESAIEENGFINFKFINGVLYKSKVLTREINQLFKIEYFNSIVSFQLEENEKKGTDLVLINSDVPENEYQEVYAGWLSVLFALKGTVDYGIDLRNHDVSRTWDQLYVEN